MLKTLTVSVFALAVGAVWFAAPAYAQRVSQLPAVQDVVQGEQGGGAFFQQRAPAVAINDGIAIIINNEIITKGEIRARLALAFMSAGIKNVPETRRKILPQVMRALIEEELIMQEAKKLGISVSDQEVQAAVAHIANGNKVPGGDMKGFLESKGIPFSTLYKQIKGSVAWNKLVMRSIRPRIEVSDDEVEVAVESLNDNAGKQEYEVSEIFLAVDKDSNEEQVKAFADKLFEQITAGAVFSSVARQFSQGTGAAAGGNIGWIREGELDPAVNKVLQSMDEASVSKPVRSGAGYHILGLRDKRVVAFSDISKVKARLGQVFKSYSDPDDLASDGLDRVIEEAETLRQRIKNCDSIESKIATTFDGWKWKDLGTLDLGSVPTWLAENVSTLKEGEASTPMATNKGVLMVYLCQRDEPTSIDRDKIRKSIGIEKMQRVSRGFLRDLRRDAYMDVRLKGGV